MSHPYADIIHLPYQKSSQRPRMSLHHRAAQFAPFTALTSHQGAIKEVARQTTDQLELGESTIEQLNEKLNVLKGQLKHQPSVTITYFQSDESKSGGAYVALTANVRRIDEVHQCLVMSQGLTIPLSSLLDIEWDGLF